ncbi:MAG TPA: AbrB/MazE/SpoVT family DNA-binding domain-containing protein [Geminicoccaceae bacterium]|nr:AbrB/MazE/SpoVT family DNA-binding domain-containing protein [Geminicoccaceae bacterium]
MASRLKVHVDRQGRMVIPAPIRAELGIENGGVLTLETDEDGVHLRSHHQAIRKIQELVRRYVPDGVSLVDELIAERRAEAAREDAEAIHKESGR